MPDPQPAANFSAEQIAALSPESRATFGASLKQAGFDVADVDAKLSSVLPASEVQASGEHADTHTAFPVPATPDGYHFDYSPARLASDPATLARYSSDLRQSLHAAEVPEIFAQSVLDALDMSAALYRPEMTDVERQAIFLEEGFKLKRAFGADGAREIGELASAAWQRLPEAWRAKMDAQFGFHTAQGQSALAAVERAYRARQARGPK